MGKCGIANVCSQLQEQYHEARHVSLSHHGVGGSVLSKVVYVDQPVTLLHVRVVCCDLLAANDPVLIIDAVELVSQWKHFVDTTVANLRSHQTRRP